MSRFKLHAIPGDQGVPTFGTRPVLIHLGWALLVAFALISAFGMFAGGYIFGGIVWLVGGLILGAARVLRLRLDLDLAMKGAYNQGLDDGNLQGREAAALALVELSALDDDRDDDAALDRLAADVERERWM